MTRPRLVIALAALFAVSASTGHLIRRTTAPEPPVASPLPHTTFHDLAATLADTSEPRILASLLENHRGDYPRQRLVVIRWAEVDPAAAADAIRANPTSLAYEQGELLELVFEAWATDDPDAAFNSAAYLTDQILAHRLTIAALEGAVTTDPDHALPRFFANIDSFGYNDARLNSRWLYNHPEISLDAFLEHAQRRPGSWSEDAHARILGSWTRTQPDAALIWAQRNWHHLNARDRRSFLPQLARSNPRAAADLFASLPPHQRHGPTAGAIIAGLAVSDPAAAFEWRDQHLTGAAHPLAVEHTLRPLAQADPSIAAPFIEEYYLLDPRLNDKTNSLMRPWVRYDPEAAIAWVRSRENPELRADAAGSLGSSWSSHDRKAFNAYIAATPPDEITAAMLSSAAKFGFPVDADQIPDILAWIETLPADHAPAAIHGFFEYRTLHDVPAAVDHALSFRFPKLQTTAIETLVPFAARSTPRGLARTIADQPDPAVRAQLLEALNTKAFDPIHTRITLQHYRDFITEE